MEIIMIRHGQSEANVARTFGDDNAVLTKEGIDQIKEARKIIEHLDFKKVYVSPLVRTKETLHYLGLEADEENRIREYDFGVFSGLTNEEIEKEYPLEYRDWIENPHDFIIKEGESLKMVYERVKHFLEEALEKDEDILLVTHAGVIRLAFCWVFDNIDYFFKFKIDNGSINIISIDDGFKFIKNSNLTKNILK